jgi:hypothetical protein
VSKTKFFLPPPPPPPSSYITIGCAIFAAASEKYSTDIPAVADTSAAAFLYAPSGNRPPAAPDAVPQNRKAASQHWESLTQLAGAFRSQAKIVRIRIRPMIKNPVNLLILQIMIQTPAETQTNN